MPAGILRRFDDYLRRAPRRRLIVVALALIAGTGIADALAGPEIFSIHPLYVVPIAAAAWYVGLRPALVLAIIAAGTWVASDRLSGRDPSHAVIPVLNTVVLLAAFIVIAALLAVIRRHLAREQVLSLTDPLTGLTNSRGFYAELERELLRAGRYRHPFSVCVIDLDNFKVVNDTHGHLTGDDVLRQVAETLTAHTRASDTIARLGGDEFVALFPETGADAARDVLATVERRLHEVMERGGWPVTSSIGGVTFDTPPDSARAAIKAADDLMYEVKRSGKNAWKHRVFRRPREARGRREPQVGNV